MIAINRHGFILSLIIYFNLFWLTSVTAEPLHKPIIQLTIADAIMKK